jgi:hypothetical protein
MALSTYTEIQAAVADYLIRSTFTNQIIDAIRLVEARLNYGGDGPNGAQIKPLRVRQMENTSYATLSAETITLPTDFLAVRTLKLTSTNPDKPLRYLTPEMQDEIYSADETGEPDSFTIVGGAYRFRKIPGGSYTLQNDYYQAIPALASNASNWLLAAAPHVYLYGALMEMRDYMKDATEAQRVGAKFVAAVEAIRRGDRDARYGGPVQMRPQWVV